MPEVRTRTVHIFVTGDLVARTLLLGALGVDDGLGYQQHEQCRQGHVERFLLSFAFLTTPSSLRQEN